MSLLRVTISAALIAASLSGVAKAELPDDHASVARFLSKYAEVLKVADNPKVCAPGATTCGADGKVYRCSYDGTRWDGGILDCKH